MIQRFGVTQSPLSLAALSLAALTLASCGGSDQAAGDGGGDQSATPPASAVAAVEPCSLISAEEVAAITGDAVKSVSPSGESCKYHAEPDDGAETLVSFADASKKMETARKSMQLLGGIGKEVSDQGGAGADTGALLTADQDNPGIGDESLWGINGTVYARKGNTYVEVMAPIMHDPATTPGIPLIKPAERREIAKAIAERMLSNAASRAN